jgi:hypothetical protein
MLDAALIAKVVGFDYAFRLLLKAPATFERLRRRQLLAEEQLIAFRMRKRANVEPVRRTALGGSFHFGLEARNGWRTALL